ncbi:MAG: hypothetical protein IJ555_05955 [Ruminococcus sp.]|nr:hypothetical protein [Ruminococcus sp.]
MTFEYAGQDTEVVDIDGGSFENDLKRGSVKGIKVNEHDEPLANAVFGIFKADTAEFTADNAIVTTTSDENGYFGFDEIPYGSYIVTEIAPPVGYIFSDKKYDVVIDEDGDEVSLTAVNDSTHLNVSKKDIYGNELSGASMQIIDSNGSVCYEWVSDGTDHVITNIPAGSYTLKEIASPDGFVIATEIRFTIDIYNNVTVDNVDALSTDSEGNPTITMVDDTTKVHIFKLDITGTKEVIGAKLQLTDSEGNIVDEWTSTSEAHIIEGQLVAGGTYTLHEEYAPDGYVVANDVTFTVSEDGSIDKVTMYDDTTKVKISKRDITNDEELAGATLQIIKDGNVVEEWVSTTEPHYIEAVLTAGETYTLHETIPADGYVIADDVDFTVDENGEITEVVMYDDTTKVHISKRDITTDKELPGATLQILDGDELIEEWVSTTDEHIIEGKLIVGKEYTLREITAPEGFEIANDITFKVNEDGSVTSVVMYDEHTPKENTPPTYTPPVSNPHTGVTPETSNMPVVLLAVSALVLVLSIVVRRKEERDEDSED